jgi:hypothetical protein
MRAKRARFSGVTDSCPRAEPHVRRDSRVRQKRSQSGRMLLATLAAKLPRRSRMLDTFDQPLQGDDDGLRASELGTNVV